MPPLIDQSELMGNFTMQGYFKGAISVDMSASSIETVELVIMRCHSWLALIRLAGVLR